MCKIWGFHGGDYEECRLLGYKNTVRTSQETHYVSATESSQLMLCNIWGFHRSDYEECRLLGYKSPVRTSQETHYLSVTEHSRLMQCKIWGFHCSDYEECRLLGYKYPVHTSQETHYVSVIESSQLMLCKIWGFHGSDYEECLLLGYKSPVRTSQETHYVSVTEQCRLMLCKIWVFRGGDTRSAWKLGPLCYGDQEVPLNTRLDALLCVLQHKRLALSIESIYKSSSLCYTTVGPVGPVGPVGQSGLKCDSYRPADNWEAPSGSACRGKLGEVEGMSTCRSSPPRSQYFGEQAFPCAHSSQFHCMSWMSFHKSWNSPSSSEQAGAGATIQRNVFPLAGPVWGIKTNSVANSPQANYTDCATATCGRNLVPTFVDRGVSCGQRGGSPTIINISFLDWSRYFSFK
jgi:hypothetical protein